MVKGIQIDASENSAEAGAYTDVVEFIMDSTTSEEDLLLEVTLEYSNETLIEEFYWKDGVLFRSFYDANEDTRVVQFKRMSRQEADLLIDGLVSRFGKAVEQNDNNSSPETETSSAA